MTFKETSQLGLYTLNANGADSVHFVVNSPRDESDLKQLSADEINALATSLNAQVTRTWQEYAQLDSTRRYGYEIWHYLFWAVLTLLFLEVFLQQWFAKRI